MQNMEFELISSALYQIKQKIVSCKNGPVPLICSRCDFWIRQWLIPLYLFGIRNLTFWPLTSEWDQNQHRTVFQLTTWPLEASSSMATISRFAPFGESQCSNHRDLIPFSSTSPPWTLHQSWPPFSDRASESLLILRVEMHHWLLHQS